MNNGEAGLIELSEVLLCAFHALTHTSDVRPFIYSSIHYFCPSFYASIFLPSVLLPHFSVLTEERSYKPASGSGHCTEIRENAVCTCSHLGMRVRECIYLCACSDV